MTSQNRMNAGAEYVLYRIWATLQDPKGIHPESLLACLGALAGYSCQAYARQAAARAGGAHASKYALTESPLSVWALVGRTVQKLGNPLPDIEGICRHVSQTLGTSAFGVLRVPDGHHPRYPAIDYLKQLWPQIQPIAQRFCRKPAQLPVLFGIALQRAIEHTKDLLSPTLGASIAMECAVAMSKVALPGAPAIERLEVSPKPIAVSQAGTRASSNPARTARTPRRKKAAVDDVRAGGLGALALRFPQARIAITIVSFAIIVTAGAMWNVDRSDAPQAVRVERKLQTLALRDTLRAPDPPIPETLADEQAQQPTAEVPAPNPVDEPTPAFVERDDNEGIIVDDGQAPLASNFDAGSGESPSSAENTAPLD